MINKGLEYIEARWLFNAAPEQIPGGDPPPSRSSTPWCSTRMVPVLAQLGNPGHGRPHRPCPGLSGSHRVRGGIFGFLQCRRVQLHSPDYERYPCLAAGHCGLPAGTGATTSLNAANEEAVAAFLAERIGFMDIAQSQRIRHAGAGHECRRLPGGSHCPGWCGRVRAQQLIKELAV